MKACFLAVGVSVLGLSAQASTVDQLSLLQSFNTIALGNLNAQSETEGTVFVGGDLNSAGYTVNGDGLADGVAGAVSGSLIVGGNVTGNPVNVDHGSIVVGGSTSATINNNGGGQFTTEAGNVPVAEVTSAMTRLSAELSGLATTAGAAADLSDQNNTKVESGDGGTGDLAGIAVLNLTALESEKFLRHGANSRFAGLDSALTTIINLAGTSLSYTSNFNVDMSNVLLNFFEAEVVNLSGGAIGFSVLAPNATVTVGGGGINGTVVGYDINQRAEIRPFGSTMLFSGSLPVAESTASISEVPLPAAGWLLIAGLVGLFGMRRRAA